MKSNKAVFILFLLIGSSVFSNGLNGEFVHDDHLILSHSLFGQPSKIFSFFSQPYFEDFYQAGLYRPLVQISFGLNFLIGSSPFGFHLVNVLLHIINSFLVYLLLKKLTSNSRLSLIASLLFLVLPIHVEAVTAISGRTELLSLFFGILTLLLWFDSKYFLSAIVLFLAFLNKESVIMVLAIIFLFNLYYHRGWRWPIYYFAAMIFYFILRIAVLGQYAFKSQVEFVFNPLAYASFFERIFTALKILVLYLQKVFVPYNLSADYSYDQISIVTNLFSSPLSLLGLVFLGLMFWEGYKILTRKKSSVLGWLFIFFFLPYLVISNLIFPTGTIMAERLMYFPSLGALMILAVFIEQLFKLSKRLGLAILLILSVVYGFITVSQNRVWANREALLTDSFKKSPNSVAAKTNYGILILNQDKELAKKLSLEVYEKYPDYIQNLNLRGAVEVQEGDYAEAEKFLERVLELRPKHQNTLQNLSRVYFTRKKYPEAEETLKILVFEYGGKGNVIFYALIQAKNRHFEEASQTIYDFFGPDVKDESALKILRGEFKELDSFYTFTFSK
ncbi:MAG: tetratricopeptide repeat protein [Patescibacteria group bacterium]